MGRKSLVASFGSVAALLHSGCGAAQTSGSEIGPTANPVANGEGAATVEDLALLYIAGWEREDAAAIEALLTCDARSAWALGGGMSKRLRDKREQYGSPLAGSGRLLDLSENGGTAMVDVGVAYSCADCGGYRLADWPPEGSTADADQLTLVRSSSGGCVISYLDGSRYLDEYTSPTRVLEAAATGTTITASRRVARTADALEAKATGTAKSVLAGSTRTANAAICSASHTAVMAQWLPQPTHTPVPTVSR